MPDICLQTPPRMASRWPVTPLIIFIFICSCNYPVPRRGKTTFILDNTLFLLLFPWFQPANTCTETASPPPLPPPQNGFLPVCLCVAADNVPPCIFVSACFSQKHHFWEMAGVLPALCTLASSHFCFCGDFRRPAARPNPNPHISSPNLNPSLTLTLKPCPNPKTFIWSCGAQHGPTSPLEWRGFSIS